MSLLSGRETEPDIRRARAAPLAVVARAIAAALILGATTAPVCRLAPRYSPAVHARKKQAGERIIRKGQTGMVLEQLQPAVVWKHFEKIRSIPHCSGREDSLARYVLEFGEQQKLETRKDEYGNVLLIVPPSEGVDNAPALVVQTHIDMVCEKNNAVEHDFATDPIELELSDGWLSARGTTLGADNGIGIACALALAETGHLRHGPLELLFTVEEEIGLVGASRLKPGFVSGRMLLNLDSEELGAVYIGCAGGSSTTIHIPLEMEPVPDGARQITLTLRGLKGGHSGIDINKARGNAIKLLTRVLSRLEAIPAIRLVSITGGSTMNAIAREASAVLAVADPEMLEKVRGVIQTAASAIKDSLGERDPALMISTVDDGPADGEMLKAESQKNLLTALLAVPHGVHTMSPDIAGLVETSNNLATVVMIEGGAEIGTMARSSSDEELSKMESRVKLAAQQSGGTVSTGERYPGWQPNLGSKLLATTTAAYAQVTGQVPAAKAIHAGLECGIIGERFAGMDMVSIGPTIEAAHSPDERVDVLSVETFWQVLTEVVRSVVP